MDELLKKASDFLNEHPELSEVELTNEFGVTVRVTRKPSVTWSWSQSDGWRQTINEGEDRC